MLSYKDQFEKLLGISLKPNSNKEVMVRCPFHQDKTPSLAINLENGVWFCHAGCGGGNIYQLEQRLGPSISVKKGRAFMSKTKLLLNEEIAKFQQLLSGDVRTYWRQRGINDETLVRARIGYDPEDDYFILPYLDSEGNCYSYKRLNRNKEEYWYPKDAECIRLFNLQDLQKAKTTGNTLYIAEGEKDCLVLMMLGYQCIGVPGVNSFAEEHVPLFEGIKNIVVCFDNDNPGRKGGERVTRLLGSKARLLIWPEGYPKDINELFLKNPDDFKKEFTSLVARAKSLVKPILKTVCEDFEEVLEYCRRFSDNQLVGIPTGFHKIDAFTGGLRGISIIGGPPKIGKSMIATTIAANVAELGYPVIYCDFENGIHKIRLRILSRLSGIAILNILRNSNLLTNHEHFNSIKERFLNLSRDLFIHRPSLNDCVEGEETGAGSTDALFRKYVKCVREEFRREQRMLIIVDSLQKLPLWNISDRRSNIDTWLRSFERARDEFDVSFLIISELSRGTYDDASIDSFKESGDIEYTADLAMQLRKNKDEKGAEVLELHAVANRDGETGIIATYTPLYTQCDFEELPDNIYREEIRNERKGR